MSMGSEHNHTKPDGKTGATLFSNQLFFILVIAVMVAKQHLFNKAIPEWGESPAWRVY